MTPVNMAKHRNNPNMPFWKMLKEGNDHFEVTHQEPKVDVCEKRYVFDAAPPPGSNASLNFNPRGQCPVYQVPDEIVAAVAQKQRADEVATAELINRGTPTVPVNLATDGGMHPVFAAAIQNAGRKIELNDFASSPPPGQIPAYVTLPPPAKNSGTAVASADPEATANVPLPRAAPRHGAITRTAYADPAPATSGNALGSLFSSNSIKNEPSMFERLSSAMGLRGSEAPAPQAAPAAPAAKPAPVPTRTANAGAIRPQPKAAASTADKAEAEAKPAPSGLLSGAAPVVPAGSFGNNWSALR